MSRPSRLHTPVIIALITFSLLAVLTMLSIGLLADSQIHAMGMMALIVPGAFLAGAGASYVLLKTRANRLMQLANLDTVTGLYNMQAIERLLTYDIERSRRYQRDLSLILLDIDDFSVILDEHGQQQADSVLSFLSKIIRQGIEYTDQQKKEFHGIRNSDIAFRYDQQDRILIIMPETDAKGAYIAAERLREAVLYTPFPLSAAPAHKGSSLRISVSAAVVHFDGKVDTQESLLKRAELLLGKAKITKNHVVIENPIHHEFRALDAGTVVTTY